MNSLVKCRRISQNVVERRKNIEEQLQNLQITFKNMIRKSSLVTSKYQQVNPIPPSTLRGSLDNKGNNFLLKIRKTPNCFVQIFYTGICNESIRKGIQI